MQLRLKLETLEEVMSTIEHVTRNDSKSCYAHVSSKQNERDKFGPLEDSVGPLEDSVGPLEDSVGPLEDSAGNIISQDF